MKRTWLIFLVLIAAAALSCLLYSRLLRPNPSRQSYLGQFELLDVTAAGQPLREGSQLQHLAEKINPRGVKLGEFEIRPATRHKDPGDAPMTAWIHYRGTNLAFPPPVSSPRWFGSRVVVVDSSGKEYENLVPNIRRSNNDEMLLALPLHSFPKDEPDFLLRFSPRPTVGTNRHWIEFRAKNPLHGIAFNWSTNSVPQTNEINGIKIVLREVNLRPASVHFEVLSSNWSVEKCTLEDANGNLHTATRVSDRTKPGHTLFTCGFRQNLDTNHPWRIHLTLRNLVDIPHEAHRLVHLNSNSPRQSITNQTGHTFACAFDGTTLSISALSGDVLNEIEKAGKLGGIGSLGETVSRFGWILRGATNTATGEKLKLPPFAPSEPVAGKPFSQTWPALSEPSSDLTVELAFPSTLQTEFQLR